MFGLGIWELLIILVLVLVLFGRKLPDLGEGLGKGIRNFRKSIKKPDEIDVTPKEGEEKEKNKKGPSETPPSTAATRQLKFLTSALGFRNTTTKPADSSGGISNLFWGFSLCRIEISWAVRSLMIFEESAFPTEMVWRSISFPSALKICPSTRTSRTLILLRLTAMPERTKTSRLPWIVSKLGRSACSDIPCCKWLFLRIVGPNQGMPLMTASILFGWAWYISVSKEKMSKRAPNRLM